jgi:hypothetical protein
MLVQQQTHVVAVIGRFAHEVAPQVWPRRECIDQRLELDAAEIAVAVAGPVPAVQREVVDEYLGGGVQLRVRITAKSESGGNDVGCGRQGILRFRRCLHPG